jgi:hypothetical protein
MDIRNAFIAMMAFFIDVRGGWSKKLKKNKAFIKY